MTTVEFKRVFSAAHRLPNDPSKCNNIHGHNYRIRVRIDADKYGPEKMVIAFDKVKEIIDHYDHALILAEHDPILEMMGKITRVVVVPGDPTTEFMADYLAEEILEMILEQPTRKQPTHVKVTIVLSETDNITSSAIRVKGRPGSKVQSR
jgi:6-pyruvoyltetrahydropterin/6-carboxytetrahydropterin synthase